jgi:predicted alpha/beta superfamily hydrolase
MSMRSLSCGVSGALLIALVVSTHQPAATGQAKGQTTSLTLHSAILNEDRAFQIYIPPEPGSGSKTIYVLDGQAQFKTVVDALSALGENRHLVIGVGNIWLRDRDYTPTKVSPSASVDAAAAAMSGGGERFFAHLAKELLPYVDSRYPVGSSRILIGHSLGGLLAVNILLNHPGVFGRFIVIDPSLWWDNSRVVMEANARLRRSFAPTALFLAIANSKNKDRNDIDAVRSDTTENTALIRPSVLLLDQFKAHQGNGIDVNWRYYKDHEHMTVFLPAVKDGLAFVLK